MVSWRANIYTFGAIALIVLSLVFFTLDTYAADLPTSAQAQAVPISENCQLDSEVGLIQVFYCESQFGPNYLVNSFGFMMVPD
jgi:hypothetical protein